MADLAPTRASGIRAADELRELLEPEASRAVYQPVVRLSDLQPVGYEGLAPCWPAFGEAGAPPAGRLLFVNVAPDALDHPDLLELATQLPARLVLQLTEQEAVRDAERLRERLRPWIARGALIAVDDAGAGFMALGHVAEIRPDFLKLCRGTVTGVDLDPGRQAMLCAAVAFARDVGARIVADGVEYPEELEVLRAAQIDYGQGWLFGRSGEAWPDEPASRSVAPARAPGGRLERELACATSMRDACEAVVVHLARRGLLPSVYLEDGGRLRCQAVRGYWQIFDGMPASAGVIGRTYRTGETTVIDDVTASEDYLPAVAAVLAEICVPVRVNGRVAGALNTESPTAQGPAGVAEIERCAAMLGTRLEEVGGKTAVSPAQRLARTAVRLAALQDPEDIVREAVAAARGLAGFESAMLALPDGHGSLEVHHAEGSFAAALGELDAGDLARIAAWVDSGTSSYTAADAGGRGFEGHEVLREAGANAVIVLPLTAASERCGLLLLADRADHRITTEAAELLELLATQAAGSLRMAAAVHELRERAARDPLTGLGHHATFYAELPAMRAATPEGRCCALLLADVDGFKAINDTSGHAAGDDVLRCVAGLLRELVPPGGRAFRIGGDEFAMVFECAGEAHARATGWELRSQARRHLGTTVSIGVAIAPPHESEELVVARADAALYEVKRRGRDGVLLAPSGTTSA